MKKEVWIIDDKEDTREAIKDFLDKFNLITDDFSHIDEAKIELEIRKRNNQNFPDYYFCDFKGAGGIACFEFYNSIREKGEENKNFYIVSGDSRTTLEQHARNNNLPLENIVDKFYMLEKLEEIFGNEKC